MADYGRDVRRLLKDHGWHPFRSAKGDHELWASPEADLKITVDHKIKSRHTANGIMKRAKIEHRF